ncbi:MAG: bacillithiol biosynthesis cysteine-adding enzyme BshC, partial [Candidatus Bipolaricaulia bacterium]
MQATVREKLAERLLSYNRALGASQTVLENIESLSSAGTHAVVTGPQPGLLTGPLYTIYKAISAITVAERLASSSGRRFIPVFWNHSEDHDFAEVGHIYLLKENRPVILAYPPPESSGPKSVAEISLEEEKIERLLSRIAEATPKSEFKDSILNQVRELVRESHDFGDFFSRMMLWLFGGHGLVLVEPRHLQELIAPIFTRLIEEPDVTGRLVAQAGKVLEREGKAPQIRHPQWFCNFFIDRQRVTYRDRRFQIGEETFSREELLLMVQEEPYRFSSDVVTRPLIQDHLFPTYAYVAGPHEGAYLDQLHGVYRWFGLETPQVIPRYGATLIETRVRRILDRYAPWAEDLEEYRQPEQLMKRVVRATSDLGLSFARYREEIARILEEIKEYV